ncbi:hypothetical protein FQZ97_744790 [compost metagenome]
MGIVPGEIEQAHRNHVSERADIAHQCNQRQDTRDQAEREWSQSAEAAGYRRCSQGPNDAEELRKGQPVGDIVLSYAVRGSDQKEVGPDCALGYEIEQHGRHSQGSIERGESHRAFVGLDVIFARGREEANEGQRQQVEQCEENQHPLHADQLISGRHDQEPERAVNQHPHDQPAKVAVWIGC